MTAAGDVTPPSSEDAGRALFGSTAPLAQRYARLLASDGVAHGHIGPREVDRLWSRP